MYICIYAYISIYLSLSLYIYIYIERERYRYIAWGAARDLEGVLVELHDDRLGHGAGDVGLAGRRRVCICIYIYIYIHTYIYIYRERDLYSINKEEEDGCCFPARATHDARCFSVGFYLAGNVNGQMKVSESTLTLGVEPVIILYEVTGRCVGGLRRPS